VWLRPHPHFADFSKMAFFFLKSFFLKNLCNCCINLNKRSHANSSTSAVGIFFVMLFGLKVLTQNSNCVQQRLLSFEDPHQCSWFTNQNQSHLLHIIVLSLRSVNFLSLVRIIHRSWVLVRDQVYFWYVGNGVFYHIYWSGQAVWQIYLHALNIIKD